MSVKDFAKVFNNLTGKDGLGDDFFEGVFEEFGEEGVEAFQKLGKEGKTFGDVLSSVWIGVKDTGKGILTAIKGVGAALAANPTILLGIAAAAALATTAIIAYNNSYDKMLQDANESGSAYDEAKTKLDDYKKELEETKDRIQELETANEASALSKSQEKELETLQEKNKLLQAQIDLQEKATKAAMEVAQQDALDVLTNDKYSSYFTGNMTQQYDPWTQTMVSTPEIGHRGLIDTIQAETESLANLQDTFNGYYDEAGNLKEGADSETALKTAELIDSTQESLDANKAQLYDLYTQLKGDGVAATGMDSGLWSETLAAAEAALGDLTQYQTEAEQKINAIKNTYAQRFEGDSNKEEFTSDFNDWIDNLSEDEQEVVYQLSLDSTAAQWSLDEWKTQLENYQTENSVDIPVEISTEQEGLEKVNSAIAESASETGLLEESISSLKSRYKELGDSFNAGELFQETANGIKLNTDYLSELETKYTDLKKSQLQDALSDQIAEYNRLQDLANKALKSGSDLAKDYQNKADAALEEVQTIQQLITQYNALNGAYAKAMNAANTANGGAMRDNVKSLWDSAKELKNAGKVGTDDFQSFVELMTGKDYNGNIMDMVNDFDKLNNKIKVMNDGVEKGTLGQSINSFFVDGKQGALNFINAIKQAGKLYDGSEWVKEVTNPETKEKELIIEANTASLSEALGISEELVFILMENLKDYGFNIDIEQGTESVDELIEQAETLQSKLKEAGQDVPPINLEINSDEIEGEINKVKKWLADLDPNSSAYGDSQQYGKTLLKGLYARKQESNGQRYDISSVDEGGKTVAAKWNEAQDALAEYNATLDTYGASSEEAKSASENLTNAANSFNDVTKESNIDFQIENTDDIEDVTSQLNDVTSIDKINLPINGESATKELDTIKITIDEINNTPITLKLETNSAMDKVEELRQAILSLNSNITINPNGNGNNGGDNNSSGTYSVVVEPATTDLGSEFTGNGIINVKPDTTNLGDSFTGKATITVKPDTYDLGSGFHGTGTISVSGESPASGTAHAIGTSGFAYSRGYWGIGNDGIALGGELGKELVVRDGKFFTIGDKGAEFFKHKKNDIIFNAAQTKSLFKYGGIKGANPRGKVYGSGSAFATGNAFNDGSTISGSANKDLWDWLNGNSSNGNSSSNNSSSSSDSSSNSDYNSDHDFFDWIEILIDRIERAIEHFEKKVDNVFDSWENRGKALNEQSDLIRKEIETQKAAYDYYISYADALGLDQKYVERIHNGTMKVTMDYDDSLRAQIEDYQEFYEKALDCKAAVDDLTVSLSECYQTAFDNVITRYDQLVAVTEHNQAMLDASISQSEAKGYLISQKYYEMQIANEQELIEQQKQKREELIKTRDTALMDGVIVEGSEAWMDMNAEIDACTEAIAESNTAIIEFNNSIQEVNWEVFDLLQEKISNVSDEAEFFINLLSNDKLFNDKGQMTSEGLVTLGLYGQRYNTYLAQAAMYADELVKINSQIEDDANNQTLIERRQELLELQQENILAAEDEKQAIADLISDGIDKQLESLQELIDTYNDALETQKDLYDYQKKVAEQAKNIAQLEKQLAVYQGSDSEEIQAKVQEIKVSLEEAKSDLEETQYDKFINDQQKLLDDLYAGYEDLLNERLDNTDALVEEMIEKINLNAEEINQTLAEKADSVGYTLSQDMQNIWNGESGTNNILTTYGDGILNATTAVNTTLNIINNNLMNMVSQLNTLADTDISAIPVTGAYKDGKKKVVNDENAWTQEGATEYIVRPSDGAILTPVAQDDSILDSYASGNIWKMANNPSGFIRENLGTGIVSAPVSGDKHTTVTQHFEKVVFDMPNVTSYNEMLESMKRDKNFERLILAFTTDQLAGKSSMRVTKSI